VVTSHGRGESEAIGRDAADIILELFEDAADRALELLRGAKMAARPRFKPLGDEIEDLS
jgi:hypothetical protein